MLKTIRLELARTPDHPNGDPRHGYEFHAPLDDAGHIDAATWRKARQRCTVRRFVPNGEDKHGHLIHTQGRRWVFHYDLDADPEDDEPGFRFDNHVFKVGEYVSLTEHDGQTRPFVVTRVV